MRLVDQAVVAGVGLFGLVPLVVDEGRERRRGVGCVARLRVGELRAAVVWRGRWFVAVLRRSPGRGTHIGDQLRMRCGGGVEGIAEVGQKAGRRQRVARERWMARTHGGEIACTQRLRGGEAVGSGQGQAKRRGVVTGVELGDQGGE